MPTHLLTNNLSPIYIPIITKQHLREYGLVANDLNPIHFEKQTAKKFGYKDCIAHGMFVSGISTKLISPWLKKNFIVKNYSTTFLHPLTVGDSLEIFGIIRINTESFAHINFYGVNQHDKKILTGSIQVEGLRVIEN